MPKRKKYEDVKLYTDVTKKEINADKKQLLKEMALAGNAGMRALNNETDRSVQDRHNIEEGSTQGVVDDLNAERDRMMGGLEVARDMQGRGHSNEMDRLAARNIAYMDRVKHAGALAQNASKERIAQMKLAADQRAAAGGGGGGGGGGFPAPIPTNADQTQESLDRLSELYLTSAGNLAQQGVDPSVIEGFSLPALERNAGLTVKLDSEFQRGLTSGLSPNEMQGSVYQIARQQGVSYQDALAIAHTIGQNYGADTNVKQLVNTGGGWVPSIREAIPGLKGSTLDSLMGLAGLHGGQVPARAQATPPSRPAPNDPRRNGAPSFSLGSG